MSEQVAPIFGKFSLGDSIVSSNATISTTRASGTGTLGTKVFSATGAFSPGQFVRIHSVLTGKKERNVVESYSPGTVNLMLPLANEYGARSQIIVIPDYRKLTINSGVTLDIPTWDGVKDGIIEICADEFFLNGTFSASGKGLRAGGAATGATGVQGEGNTNTGGASAAANENGGGAGINNNAAGGGGNHQGSATNGSPGGGTGGLAGSTFGSTALTDIFLGGGGGSGSNASGAGVSGSGGVGGGIIILNVRRLIIDNSTGLLLASGNNGNVSSGSDGSPGSGGGGAGGSILIRAQYADIGTNLVKANGGNGGDGPSSDLGGTGGKGRIRLEVGQLVGSTNQGDVSVVEGGQIWQGKLGL